MMAQSTEGSPGRQGQHYGLQHACLQGGCRQGPLRPLGESVRRHPMNHPPVANGLLTPWADSDAWRFQGHFTRWNRYRGTLPGLGTATVLFAGYCTYEHFFMQDEHHHGEEEAHH